MEINFTSLTGNFNHILTQILKSSLPSRPEQLQHPYRLVFMAWLNYIWPPCRNRKIANLLHAHICNQVFTSFLLVFCQFTI